ncbi:MAG: hypothetical protein APF84_02150 [Gracilibacter sp. BRH_c7a]|nr:MAG: hypothetical protein APF84_02150 [Gracilibacter sp. BRH_c7a]
MPKIAVIIVGIILFLIVSFIMVAFLADFLFNLKVDREINALLAKRIDNDDIVKQEDLDKLPSPVQRWLENSQVVGKDSVRDVRLKQTGVMRTEPDKPWMSFKAEQYFVTENPGFIWKAKINVAPMFHISGRDKYDEGKGNMLIKVLSLITLGDATGEEIDQGTMLRYLAEMMWFPAAALNDYIQWEAVDERSAKATMSYKGVTASAIFLFDENGDIASFSAKRYGDFGGQFSLETWSGSVKEIKVIDGIRIPTQGEVTWELEAGDFTWLKWEITEIEYNNPTVY